MAKTKSSKGGLMTGAAEIIGGTLGTIAGTISRLKADDRHPAPEAKKALAATKAATPKAGKRGKKVVRRARQTPARRRASARSK